MIFLYQAKSLYCDSDTERSIPIVVVLDPIAKKDTLAWKSILESVAKRANRPVYGLSSRSLNGYEEDIGFEPVDVDLWMALDLVVPAKDDHSLLSTEMLGFLLTLRMKSVRTLQMDGHFLPYSRPIVPGARRVLFLFPGIFCPPEMGSHQRACSSVLALLNAGFEVDVIVRASRNQFQAKERFLRLLSNRAEWFFAPRAEKGKLRKAYEERCQTADIRARFPLTLQERMRPLNSKDSRQAVKGLLAGRNYDSVFASYIWWHDLIQSVDLGGTQLIYDTHDVHTMRLIQHLDAVAEEFFDLDAERNLEIDILRKADHVLSISDRDQEVFEEDYGLENIVKLPVPYIGAGKVGSLAPSMQPLTFGFLGSGMDANVRALEFVFKHWWPTIHRFTPESRFLIAGAIADDPTVQDICFLRDEIELLGRVEFVSSFYKEIDVLLSPVIIPGGLNIKMVEALLNKCIVITNDLGAQPLLPLEIVTKANSAEEVVELIEAIESTSGSLRNAISENFETARQLYQVQDNAAQAVRSVFYKGYSSCAGIGDRSQPFSAVTDWKTGKRVLPMALSLKDAGWLPVVFIDRLERGAGLFLAHGMGAVPVATTQVPSNYRPSFTPKVNELCPLAMQRTWAKGGLFDQKKHRDTYRKYSYILDQLQPSMICAWNGFTGEAANALRCYKDHHGIPGGFMERGISGKSVFFDPNGVNGYSSLSQDATPPSISPASVSSHLRKYYDQLDSGTKPRNTRILVPLQVQDDSNIFLFGNRILKMRDLVSYAVKVAQELGEDWKVVVRPHPEERHDTRLNLPQNDRIEFDAISPLEDVIKSSSICLTINSTVGLEAALLGATTICLGEGIYCRQPFIIQGQNLPASEVASETRKRLLASSSYEAEKRAFLKRVQSHHQVFYTRGTTALGLKGEWRKGARRARLSLREMVRLAPRKQNRFFFQSAALEKAWGKLQKLSAGPPLDIHIFLKPQDRLFLTYRKVSERITKAYLQSILEERGIPVGSFSRMEAARPGKNCIAILHSSSDHDLSGYNLVLDEYGYPHLKNYL